MVHVVAYGLPILLVAVAAPLALGLIPPNRMYGFRTPKTLSSPGLWYPANRFAGWSMIAAGELTICVNLVLCWRHPDWDPATPMLWTAGASVVPLVLSLVVSFLYLRRL
jgi:uncharacterized membrane protein